MRPASAFRSETLRFPPGERGEPVGPLRATPTQLIPLRGWGAGRRRFLSAETFSFPLFPGLLMPWHYCGGGRVLSSTLLKSRETSCREAWLCRRTMCGFGHLVTFKSCWGCLGRMWRDAFLGDVAQHQLLLFMNALKHQSGTSSLCQL